MNDTHTKELALSRWVLITVAILGVALITYSIWSLSRALIKVPAETTERPSPLVAVSSVGQNMNITLTPLQIETIRQHDMMEQQPAPVIQPPVAAQPAAVPTNKPNKAVMLQKAKANVNQKIVERMKQYVRENPNRDTRDIQAQIKKRENQGAQGQ